MDVSWRWQLPILLIVICAILGCGTSGAQCQDNSSLGNDSIFTQDTIAKGSLSNEGIRHGMNALGRLPHDVRCTGHDERSSLAEMEFTNNFNTCPANETVWNLPCDDIISGCGTSEAQCQNNSRFGNDSIYTQDTIVKGSLIKEGIRHGMNALGRLPHDVRCTGHDEKSSLGEMEFTNNFNTCPANETVGNLPYDDIISGGSCQIPIESDPGFTFQLDVFGVCYNVTVIEVNGGKIDYLEMFEKLNLLLVPEETTNDSTLYKTEISESDEMKVNFPSNFVVHISENKSRILNVTAVSHTGKCRDLGIRRKVAKTWLYEAFESSRKYSTRRKRPSTSSQNPTIAMYMMPSVCVAIVFAILMWLSYSVGCYVALIQHSQRGAVHVPPAPAG